MPLRVFNLVCVCPDRTSRERRSHRASFLSRPTRTATPLDPLVIFALSALLDIRGTKLEVQEADYCHKYHENVQK